jgi:hypothetical protein
MIRKIDVLFVLLLFVGLVSFVLVAPSDYEDAMTGQNEYCEMIAQWQASNGENGWPPFRGTAICK